MAFSTILWDLADDPNGNVAHCAEHGVSQDEIEDVLANPTDTGVSRKSGRPIAFGNTQTGRHLLVVYEEVDADTIYPITAFDVPPRVAS